MFVYVWCVWCVVCACVLCARRFKEPPFAAIFGFLDRCAQRRYCDRARGSQTPVLVGAPAGGRSMTVFPPGQRPRCCRGIGRPSAVRGCSTSHPQETLRHATTVQDRNKNTHRHQNVRSARHCARGSPGGPCRHQRGWNH
jgi:hypothetical protein